MGVCTKERKGVTAAVLMATPCTNSLGGESGGPAAPSAQTRLKSVPPQLESREAEGRLPGAG